MDINVQTKLNKFFNQYIPQEYRKKELLIRADEQPSGVIYLKDGIVRMYAVSAQGEEVVINTFKSPSFFPMPWVLNDTLSRYYYETATKAVVYRAPKEEFLKFLVQEPEVVMDLLKRIQTGLEGYFLRMEYLMTGNAASRLITEILINAKRFGESYGKNTVVRLKLTEKDLAAQSGIARETVSRILGKLKQKGLIDFQKNILSVRDLPALEVELVHS